MRRLGRKWRSALPLILFLCLALTLAMAVYTYRYEPDRYLASYTLFALPGGVAREEDALTASRMLARDCDRLLQTASFQAQVLSHTPSDGSTYVTAAGVDGTHMIRVNALGVDPAIAYGLAQGAGRALVEQAAQTLGALQVQEIQAATLPTLPYGPDRPLKVALTLLVSFGMLSLLGMLLGSSRRPLCWRRGLPAQELAGCVAAVADCAPAARKQQKQSARSREVTLYSRAGLLAQESVRGAALAVRAMLGRRGCSLVLTGLEENGNDAAVSLLLASELAAEGFDVLLMELDAYTPTLGGLLGVQGQKDVGDCLRDENALREAILPTPVPRLCFMDICHGPEMVPALAATEAFAAFLSDAAHSFDYVILHAPPVGETSDGGLLGAVADLTLLLVPDGRYTPQEIGGAGEGLGRVVRRYGGFLLSGVPKGRFQQGKTYSQAARQA